MECSTINLIIQGFIAIGTIAIAILAIWGEKIRNYFASPRLEFSLYNARGDLTTWQNGKKVIYYHLKIKNKRQWAPARRVRILCTAISKRAPDGSFLPERLIIPVQLKWPFPDRSDSLKNIIKEEICDIGFLEEHAKEFKLALYIYPNNFQGTISANEAMRIDLIASAENFESKSPYSLEIVWDGKWSPDINEMQRHLVIKEF
jgi:hypothetical protein